MSPFPALSRPPCPHGPRREAPAPPRSGPWKRSTKAPPRLPAPQNPSPVSVERSHASARFTLARITRPASLVCRSPRPRPLPRKSAKQPRDFLLTCDQPSHANALKTQPNPLTPTSSRVRHGSSPDLPNAAPPSHPADPRHVPAPSPRGKRFPRSARSPLPKGGLGGVRTRKIRLVSTKTFRSHLQPVVPSIPSTTIPCDGHPGDPQLTPRPHRVHTASTPRPHCVHTVPTLRPHSPNTLPTLAPHPANTASHTWCVARRKRFPRPRPIPIPRSPLPANH
jgi:hypothetical protein